MLGCVVDGEAVPEFIGHFRAVEIAQGLAPVAVEVVHHQVDRFGFGVFQGQVKEDLREFEPRTVPRRESEVASGFRLYCAENIGRAAAFVFVVSSGFPARCCRRCRADVRVQRHRFLIQADYRLAGIVRPLIRFQHILHLGNVLLIEVGHGRGRDVGRPAPPAQIPTSGITAWGSYLG